MNQLHATFQAGGLEIVAANHAQDDAAIANFIATYSVTYPVARVADSSGYTVPIYETGFAIGRDGRLLWTGPMSSVTDTMVQDWLAAVPAGDSAQADEDDDEGCSTASGGSGGLLWLLAVALVVISRTIIFGRRDASARNGLQEAGVAVRDRAPAPDHVGVKYMRTRSTKYLLAGAIALLAAGFATGASAQVLLTQCTDNNTIVAANGVSCNAGGAVADNQWWRVYDLSTALPNTDFRVEALRVGIEESSTAPNTFEMRVYINTGGAFPAGTRTQQGSTQVIVEPFAGIYSSSIQVFAFDNPINIPQNSQLVVEFAVLDNQAMGGRFFPGTNTSGESSPTYLSSTGCGVTTPTPVSSLGAFTNHFILDVLGNGPEMDVQRPAGTSIADGGNHSLGNVLQGSPQQFTFTIQNTGRDDLDLPSTIVLTPGTGAPTVSVVTPPATTVSFNTGTNTTTFIVSVTAPAGGFDFTVSIPSGVSTTSGLDFNENPYNFTVTGTGISNVPPAFTVPAGSNWVDAGGGLFTLTLQPGATFNDSLELNDATPDNMTLTVTNPATAMTGLTAQPASIAAPTAGPITLTWTGTADASNTPGNFNWTLDANDGTSSTVITARIIIVDTAPQHTAAGSTGGDGSVGTPYTASYAQNDPATLVVNLANVSDANTGQTLNVGNVNQTSGPTAGSGFVISLVGGVLSVAPSATLVAADVGTQVFSMDITDGGANTVTVYVSINVLGNSGAITITNASPLPAGVAGSVYTTVTLTATGGTGPYTWSITAGALPVGLSLSPAGDITGTPTTAGVANFTVRAVDSLNDSATKVFTLTINAPSSGSGGGGGGGGGGCAAETGGSYSWLALLGLLSLGALAIRMRKA